MAKVTSSPECGTKNKVPAVATRLNGFTTAVSLAQWERSEFSCAEASVGL